FTPRPWRTAPTLSTWMLGMFTPRRPSESPGFAAAPRVEVAFGTDSRPPTADRLVIVLLRPAAAPCALSTTEDSDSGLMVPVVSGVDRSIDGMVLLLAAPFVDTPTLGSERFSAEIEDVDVSGERALAADAGVPCLGSMLAAPLSLRMLRLRSEPLFPRATLMPVVVAWVVPTPLVAAPAGPPAATAAPTNATSDAAAPNIRNLRMVLPRSTETTINPYFRRWASGRPWPTGVKSAPPMGLVMCAPPRSRVGGAV